MAKKEQKIKVECVGQAGSKVTGSSYLVTAPTGEKILLDCGLHQTPNKYESWKINQKKLKYRPADLTLVAISHLNIDHLGLVPYIYDKGCTAPIFMAYDNIDFVIPMLEDCAKIMDREAIGFTRKYKKPHAALFTPESVKDALGYFRGVDYNRITQVTENVGIQFIPAGHIFGSCQIVLYIKKPSGNIVKIAYSGDLGNIIFEQPFVKDFERINNANMYIGECTYNSALRSVKKHQRDKDLQKLENVIRQTCIEKKGQVLIPTFALQRTETMLYMIWKIFKDDASFNIPIVIDSPLGIKVLDCFLQNLEGEESDTLQQILAWKNVHIIRTLEDSKACVEDRQPKVILSSSGMLVQGRSVLYLKKILPRANSAILLCGYQAEGTLGYSIKNTPSQRTITIDDVAYKNRCDLKVLKSFSSHMQYEELMSYYTGLANNGCSTIWLVHGDDDKKGFKDALEQRIRKIGKTTKIVATNNDTVAWV